MNHHRSHHSLTCADSMNVHLLPIAFLPSCPPPIRSSSWEEVRGLIWAHPWIIKAALIEVVQWYTPGCWLLSSRYRQGIWATTHQQQSYFYVHSHRVADFDRKSNCSILNHFYNIITNREALAAGFPRWLVGYLDLKGLQRQRVLLAKETTNALGTTWSLVEITNWNG